MTESRYPGAEWLGNGRSGGTYIGDVPYRIVLHTTETEGLPSYSAGATAPHLTYDPRRRHWYQHTDLTHAARALRNMTGGVETNRARALQVELVCYSARHIADDSPLHRDWVGDLDDFAYADIREFIRWAGVEFDVLNAWPGNQAFSYDAANEPGFRLSGPEWRMFGGVCGHQHVPENTHWDPGALDWTRVIIEKDDMALTPAAENAAEDWNAAFGSMPRASQQALMAKLVAIGRAYPADPDELDEATGTGLNRGDTVRLV